MPTYLEQNYGWITPNSVSLVKSVEFDHDYEVSIVSTTGNTPVTLVLTVNKQTAKIATIGTYTEADIPLTYQMTPLSKVSSEPINANSTLIKESVKFIEKSDQIAINNVQSVANLAVSTTAFGNQKISL